MDEDYFLSPFSGRVGAFAAYLFRKSGDAVSQVICEPFAGGFGYLLQFAGFLEQMGGSGDDHELLFAARFSGNIPANRSTSSMSSRRFAGNK
jgi:hypothetical protein